MNTNNGIKNALKASKMKTVGFMEDPDVPLALENCKRFGESFEIMETTFYVSRETVIPGVIGRNIHPWRARLFAFMSKNATSATDFFKFTTNFNPSVFLLNDADSTDYIIGVTPVPAASGCEQQTIPFAAHEGERVARPRPLPTKFIAGY